MAPWVILTLLILRPEGAKAYGVSVVAFRLMIRIGRLPEPRRWFG